MIVSNEDIKIKTINQKNKMNTHLISREKQQN
jgi:hypothetical protein